MKALHLSNVVTGQHHTYYQPAQTHLVVGVVKTDKYNSIGEDPRGYFYLPYAQHFGREMTLLARTMSDPSAIIPAARDRLKQLAPNVALHGETTLAEQVELAKGAIALGAALGGICGALESHSQASACTR